MRGRFPFSTPMIFFSRNLGHEVSLETLDQLHPDDADDLIGEVGAELSKVNAQIKLRNRDASGRLSDELIDLRTRRATLAAMHQQLLTGRSRRNREQKQQRQQRYETTVEVTLAHHFIQVVRSEANYVDYQRWILQAEIRQKAEIVRQQRKAQAPVAIARRSAAS